MLRAMECARDILPVKLAKLDRVGVVGGDYIEKVFVCVYVCVWVWVGVCVCVRETVSVETLHAQYTPNTLLATALTVELDVPAAVPLEPVLPALLLWLTAALGSSNTNTGHPGCGDTNAPTK